jgi:hypothetical protein
MVTPIRPSLAQMLNGPTPPAPQPQAAQAGGFASALAAQKAFFQQVTSGQAPASAPKITPATFTAADVARGASAPAADPNAPPKRPGSYVNIVV